MVDNKATQVVLLPYHGQGHMNTMVQFAKRLAWKGVQVTITTSTSTTQKMISSISSSSITIESIYDDSDESTLFIKDRMARFAAQGAPNLARVLDSKKKQARNSKCLLVYYGGLHWALEVAHRHDVVAAAFFTQAAASIVCYYCLHLKSEGEVVEPELPAVLPSPEMILQKLPKSFLAHKDVSNDETKNTGLPPMVLWLVKEFGNPVKPDFLFINSFDKLEKEAIAWMSNIWNVKSIGPTVPSAYLDKRMADDVDYGFNQHKPTDQDCISWLNTKPAGSVAYIAFGSVARLSVEQTAELAAALKQIPGSFLWVVRETEQSKLPDNFICEVSEKGLVLPWCPQLDVLAHKAVGCFVSHCGWNSTMEALTFGVPVLAMPQFLDQVVDAHFVERVWGVGVRPRENEESLVTSEEIGHCLAEIMRSEKIKENAGKWKELAKEALDEGGSSDKHIDQTIEWLASSRV